MTILKTHQILMRNLKGEFEERSLYFMSKEKAYKELKRISGQDFGYDIEAWQKWVSQNKDKF